MAVMVLPLPEEVLKTEMIILLVASISSTLPFPYCGRLLLFI
jgi:hypothetical protein